MAHMYTELQMIKEALQKYQNLIEAGFSKSTYIISQIAVAYHNIRGFQTFFKVLNVRKMLCEQEESNGNLSLFIKDIDQALALFNELREHDPYRIDNMDTFSNLLYVKVSLQLLNVLSQIWDVSTWSIGMKWISWKSWGPFISLFSQCFVSLQSMKPELSYLAHNLVEIDKYRVETCCVIGKQ